jgi:transposase
MEPVWMTKPYSVDLRERVAFAVGRDGMSRQAAARRFGVVASTAIHWVKRFSETGSLTPDQIGGHCEKKISGTHDEWLVRRCREREFNLRGLVIELSERGVVVSYSTVWKFVHANKLSYEKTVLATEQDRPDVARRRLFWKKYQGLIDPSRLVSIDETWTKTNMAPLRGWAQDQVKIIQQKRDRAEQCEKQRPRQINGAVTDGIDQSTGKRRTHGKRPTHHAAQKLGQQAGARRTGEMMRHERQYQTYTQKSDSTRNRVRDQGSLRDDRERWPFRTHDIVFSLGSQSDRVHRKFLPVR